MVFWLISLGPHNHAAFPLFFLNSKNINQAQKRKSTDYAMYMYVLCRALISTCYVHTKSNFFYFLVCVVCIRHLYSVSNRMDKQFSSLFALNKALL